MFISDVYNNEIENRREKQSLLQTEVRNESESIRQKILFLVCIMSKFCISFGSESIYSSRVNYWWRRSSLSINLKFIFVFIFKDTYDRWWISFR